jgi:hypothetical protein
MGTEGANDLFGTLLLALGITVPPLVLLAPHIESHTPGSTSVQKWPLSRP